MAKPFYGTRGLGRITIRDGRDCRGPATSRLRYVAFRWLAKREKAGALRDSGRCRRGIGGAEAPPWWLAECRHLEIGRLPADGLAGIFGLALVGLPALTDDVLVGGNGAFCCHTQGM